MSNRYTPLFASLLLLATAPAAHAIETYPFAALQSRLAAASARGEVVRGELRTELDPQGLQTLEVELVGVIENGIGPGIDMILGRLAGAKGTFTGVAAGMSGSPVIVDGKLVGALSYSIGALTREPLCGITPIETMLALSSYPAGARPWLGGAARSAAGASIAPIPLALQFAGMPREVLAGAGDLLEQLGLDERTALAPPATGAPDAARAQLQPGQSVSAVLVWGDLRLGATGTVTWREGDRLLAFGHPFMSDGRTSMPLAPADVVWTVASQLDAYKIARIGQPVGTVLQDRLTAIEGRIGEVPAGIPITVTVRREGRPEVVRHFQVVADPQLGSTLGELVLRVTLSRERGADREEALRMTGRVTLAGGRTLPLAASGPGGQVPPELVLSQELGRVVGALLRAPVALPAITGVEVEVTSVAPEGAWSVRRAMPDRLTARAGEKVRVAVDLAGPRGSEKRVALDVAVPPDTAPGSYALLAASPRQVAVESGTSGELRRRTAKTAEDYLAALSEAPRDDVLSVVLVESADGLVTQGRDYPALPPDAQLLLRGRPGGIEAARSRLVVRAAADVPLERAVAGAARATLEIVPSNVTH